MKYQLSVQQASDRRPGSDGGSRALLRAKLINEHLPEVVDEALADPEIVAGCQRVGLSLADARQQVFDARSEVLTPADTELDQLVDAVPAEPPQRSAGLVIFGALVVCVPIALTVWFWAGMAGWVAFLAIAGDVITTLVGTVAIIVGIVPESGQGTAFEDAKRKWLRVCRDDGVLPFLRRVINERHEPIQRTSLAVSEQDAAGLVELRESSFAVQTTSVGTFTRAIRRVPVGAIGLAGPRGVGKTTLLEYFADQADDTLTRPIKVLVSAPVRYEPREFILHVFARVCREVIKQARQGPRHHGWRSLVWGLVLAITALGAAVPVLGPEVFVRPWLIIDGLLAPEPWLLPSAVLTVGAVLLVLIRPVHRWWYARRNPGIAAIARRHLDEIQYLQTHTTGWSGKLILPLRGETGWDRSVARERRSQTYPEIVDSLRGFLDEYATETGERRAVVIAIDELDKIESAEQARSFINEIKGVFDSPGTQFLVSVSEDALASFEGRGVPVRDAFDSAFHEIVRVDHLALGDTRQLLNGRVIGLPAPFVRLAHCMSGGLPRDVVRVARSMIDVASHSDTPPSLDVVCAELVADDLQRKAYAFQTACREIGDAPEVTRFIRQLRSLEASAPALLALLPDLLPSGQDNPGEALAKLRRQAATYVYHCATLLETFTTEMDDRLEARDGFAATLDVNASFDTLATAKHTLAVHPRLAWLLMDEFRAAWRLPQAPAD